ncbi:MAG: desulfoferrodoxin [Desulfobacteraceae bacterium]|jgi:superoxide reductase
MAEKMEVYKCVVCTNVVEVLRGGNGELVCCGKPMKNMRENTEDAANEKHVPVVEKLDGKVRVTVGSTLHPMEEKHYIEWIQVLTDDGTSYRKYLEPGQEPAAEFPVTSGRITAREYCNLHGLWKFES